MSKPTVLIVAGEPTVRSELKSHLTADYRVDEAADGLACLRRLTDRPPQLIILDARTAGLDGWKTLQRVRATAPVPVILLVATPGERIRALDLGADDAIAKPADPSEVAARTTAVLRRYGAKRRRTVAGVQDTLTFDPASQSVTYRGREVVLTRFQYGVLAMLAARPGQAISRQELWDRVWGPGAVGDLRIIDRHVMHLRRKLDGIVIVNVWGIGYRLMVGVQEDRSYCVELSPAKA